MLAALSIRNLAVIESVTVSFHEGFHVLTGETGAGKSIIIDALSLIIGGRGSADMIRYGCEKADVEALFELPADHPVWEVLAKLGIHATPEEYLVIRRELSIQGKSLSRINGQLINLTMLREIGDHLVNIHGQHEHQSLLKVDQHLSLLDTYGEASIAPVKAAYQEVYERHRALRKELLELQDTSQKSFQKLDLYRFQIDEITSAELVVGEDEVLLEEKRRLANSEKMMDAVGDAYQHIYGNKGLDAISKVLSRLEDISAFDPARVSPIVEQLQSAYYQMEDVAYQLRDYREDIEFNPARLADVEERLDLINTLRRKYGDSIEEILSYLDKIYRETEMIENKDEMILKLQAQVDREFAQLVSLARKLSALRKQSAVQLAAVMEQELKSLQMERTRLEVKLEMMEAQDGYELDGVKIRFTKHGFDAAEFLISPNPGEPLRSLHKIASGGELSRLMLALKSIFASIDRVPVLVFDEVDTGVSGRAAQSIAEKMSSLSRQCQVFSITHLPQVACMSDHQYLIQKDVIDQRTMTQVQELSDEGRIKELARMLGGVEITEKTLHHAQEMLILADTRKAV